MLVCVDTIYVDSLFALNLIADYLLLLLGARVSGAVIHRLRIAAAAVVGAAYSVAAVVPEWGFLTSPLPKTFFNYFPRKLFPKVYHIFLYNKFP